MLDEVALAPYAQHVLAQAEIPGLPQHQRGKEPENYDLLDGRSVLIATDLRRAWREKVCNPALA